MRTRVAGAAIGIVFGITLCWSGMSSPNVIRQALLFERSYLFLFFASAVFTAAVGLQVLRRVQTRAALTGGPLTWTPESPARRHVVGAALFGIGWGVADACPGPIATQVGQGIAWSLFTMAGTVAGVYLFLRRGARETEPAVDTSAETMPLRPSVEPAG
ncbi:MAG: uncharacterized protein QOI98_330 [Solirubrobacteraceae bacterium]|jgi:uncharacterized membrane protein YedE/YeeE|nr:uncharacterized protein [Solirubrobacteraceae bacterium]